MNSKTVSNNCLRKPCAYQRACELKLPGPRLITRSKLERFLQNVMTINSRHSAEKLNNQTKKFTHPAVALPRFTREFVCTTHLRSVI